MSGSPSSEPAPATVADKSADAAKGARRRGLPTRWLLAIGLAGHLVFQLAPAYQSVTTGPHARDYASYHYAVKAAARGLDPYDPQQLDALARAERTRKTVQPYFYPPPFLLGMSWALPLSLRQAYLAMLALNELALAGVLAACVRWFRMPVWCVALVLLAYTPLPDNATMGQANLLVLLPALAGAGMLLAQASSPRRDALGGGLLGLAAMLKMSPALLLGWVALRGRWRAVGAAIVTAIVLTLLSLPLVGAHDQVRFVTEVLPGFASGSYHGLTIPLSLPSNHSIPDLWNRLWPSPSRTRLSDAAQWASRLTTLGLLGAWGWAYVRAAHPAWLGRFGRAGVSAHDGGNDGRGEALRRGRQPSPPHESRDGADTDVLAVAALLVIMVVVPAYTYEHHLVFLVPTVGAAASLVGRGRRWALAFAVLFFFLAWPLAWLRAAQDAVPTVLAPLVRESKFLAAMGFFGMCLVALAQGAPTNRTGPLADGPARA